MGTRYKRVTIVGTPNSSVTRASRYLDKLFRNHAIGKYIRRKLATHAGRTITISVNNKGQNYVKSKNRFLIHYDPIVAHYKIRKYRRCDNGKSKENDPIAVLAHEFAHTQPFGKLNEDTAIHCFENAVLKDLNKPLRCEKGLMAEREKCPNLDPYR